MEGYSAGAETDEDTLDTDYGTTTPVDPSLSVLGNLRARREQVVQKSYTDLRVPRWSEPELFVRYAPVKHSIIQHAMEMASNGSKKPGRQGNRELQANIDVLIAGCQGVYAVLDGERYSLRPGDPNGSWTGFDADLAENLGCGQSATDVVRSLYIADGDILSAASEVTKFSGYVEAEASEVVEGE